MSANLQNGKPHEEVKKEIVMKAFERLEKTAGVWDSGKPTDLMEEYDRQIVTYDTDIAHNNWNGPRYTAEAVKRHIPNNKNALILDVCGGTGAVAVDLRKLGYENLDYLDGSNEMTREAIKRNLYNSYIRQIIPEDAPTLIRSNMYDAAVISGGHITIGKIDDMIRVLKRGGIFIAAIVETTEVDQKEAAVVMDHFKKLGKTSCAIVEHTQVPDMISRGDEKDPAPGHIIVVQKA